jgi:hypothetical protein
VVYVLPQNPNANPNPPNPNANLPNPNAILPNPNPNSSPTDGFCEDPVNVQVYSTARDEIGGKLGGSIGHNAKTKNVENVITLQYYKPWQALPQVLSLTDLAQIGDDTVISPMQMSALLFQIVWTLAVCQSTWQGFEHGGLAQSINIYRYGGARIFKIRCQNIEFFIPENTPSPVIFNMARAMVSEPGSNLRQRYVDDAPFNPLRDLVSVLELLTNGTAPFACFEPCRRLYEEVLLNPTSTPSGLLFSDVFSEFMTPRQTRTRLGTDVLEIVNLKI